MKNCHRTYLNEFKTFIFLRSAGRQYHNLTVNTVKSHVYVWAYVYI